MADRKYLQQRGNRWYVRIPHPPGEWGLGSKEFVASLGTSDLKTAQSIRNRFVIPLLAATAVGRMLETLARLMSETDQEIADRLRQLRPGLTGAISGRLALREAADKFMGFLESSGSYSAATVAKYGSSTDAVCRLLGDGADPATLTKADVTAMRDRMLTLPRAWQRMSREPTPARKGEQKLSAKSVDRILTVMRRMFRWLTAEGHLAGPNDCFEGIGVARTATNHKRAPTPEEAEAMMNLPCPKAIGADTWKMMPLLARYTGCRAGELAQLRAEDVVTVQGIRCLKITGRGDGRRLKTASSERLVPVAHKLAAPLDELLEKRKKKRLLDAGDWHGADGVVKYAHAFLKHYNRRAKAVAPDLSFHCWRVYANDAMASAGVDILDRERLLGHKSTRTQAAYTPENLRRLKAAVDSIP